MRDATAVCASREASFRNGRCAGLALPLLYHVAGHGAVPIWGKPMDERRRSRRNRTFLHGSIAFNHRLSTFDCTIRDLSPDGALLEFSEVVAIPATFDLTIRHKGDSRVAHLAWRRDAHIGVFFEQRLGEFVIPIEAARRIRSLEAERDELRQRIRQISEPA